MAAIVFSRAGRTADFDVGGIKLCVVEEKGGLGCGLFLEGHSCGLSVTGGGNFDASDLSTVGSIRDGTMFEGRS